MYDTKNCSHCGRLKTDCRKWQEPRDAQAYQECDEARERYFEEMRQRLQRSFGLKNGSVIELKDNGDTQPLVGINKEPPTEL